jgi:hypothetical protein
MQFLVYFFGFVFAAQTFQNVLPTPLETCGDEYRRLKSKVINVWRNNGDVISVDSLKKFFNDHAGDFLISGVSSLAAYTLGRKLASMIFESSVCAKSLALFIGLIIVSFYGSTLGKRAILSRKDLVTLVIASAIVTGACSLLANTTTGIIRKGFWDAGHQHNFKRALLVAMLSAGAGGLACTTSYFFRN